MRPLLVALLLVGAAGALADDRARSRTDLDVVVPVDPHEHERLHYFGRRGDLPVPNVVSINGDAYVCDVHALGFRERDPFVAHLQTAHRAQLDRLRDLVVVIDGRAHFVGE